MRIVPGSSNTLLILTALCAVWFRLLEELMPTHVLSLSRPVPLPC